MKTFRSKHIAAFLIFTISSLLIDTASGIAQQVSCTPKACCRTITGAADMHLRHRLLPADSDCILQKPAACCHLRTVLSKAVPAILPKPNVSPQRIVIMSLSTNEMLPGPHQAAGQMSILRGKRTKTPTTPIYLMIQALLC